MPKTFFRDYTKRSNLQNKCSTVLTCAREHYSLINEFNTLRNLRDVINTHGMSRGLLSFANHGNVLAPLIKTIPATESLDNVPISKKDTRHAAALEGLDATLMQEPMVNSDWLRQLANQLEALFQNTSDVVVDLQSAIEENSNDLQTHTISEIVFDTTVVTTRTAQCFEIILSTLTRRIQQISSIDVDSLLSSEQYNTNNADYINDLIEELKPMLGYNNDNTDNCVQVDSDAIDDTYCSQEGSLSDLGYTTDTTLELLTSLATLVQTLQELDDRRTDIISSLTQIADRFSGDDTKEYNSMPTGVAKLISNYAIVITQLIQDSVQTVHSVLAIVEDVLENDIDRSDDGRSD